MARKQVLVQLDDALVGDIDQLASELGISRSALIRRSLGVYVSAARQAETDRRDAEIYRKNPDTPEELEVYDAWMRLGLEGWPEWK